MSPKATPVTRCVTKLCVKKELLCDNVVTCVRACVCVAGWVCLKELYVTMLYVKELCVCVTMCEKCVRVCVWVCVCVFATPAALHVRAGRRARSSAIANGHWETSIWTSEMFPMVLPNPSMLIPLGAVR